MGLDSVVQALKKHDAQLEIQHQALNEQLQKAEKAIVKLQGSVKVLAAQACCTQKSQHKALRQREETIQRLHAEIEQAQTEWHKNIQQISSEVVLKDTKIISLQEKETNLRMELERNREQIDRYRQQLKAGLEREKALEHTGVQLELEWKRRCEDLTAKHYLANEQLIQDLTEARDQAKAELKDKEQEVQDLTVLLQSVRMERDQAVQRLTAKQNSLGSEEIHRLQEQNHILRTVVLQMRKNMESLSQSTPHPHRPQGSCLQRQGPSAASSIQKATETLNQLKVTATGGSYPAECATAEKPSVKHTESVLANQTSQEGLVSVDDSENVLPPKRNPHLLRRRLKQAASCIVRLSKEKQQLIEMGNRLRAKVDAVGTREAEIEPEKDNFMENRENQPDLPSVLEQLQYQLTMQELQYAVKQRELTAGHQPPAGKINQAPPPKGNPTEEPGRLKKKENAALVSLPRTLSPSEESLQSFEGLWKTLGSRLHDSVFSEAELNRNEVAETDGWEVWISPRLRGIHDQPEAPQRRDLFKPSSTKTGITGDPGRIGKIRNYNEKD
ncbi:coiled-coil domain-containing protein 57 [Pholidichthys leucotaenia]